MKCNTPSSKPMLLREGGGEGWLLKIHFNLYNLKLDSFIKQAEFKLGTSWPDSAYAQL